MIHNKLKKVTATAVSFSIVATMSPQAYANDFIVSQTISPKTTSVTQPHFPSNFAMKAFDSKNSNPLDLKNRKAIVNGKVIFKNGDLKMIGFDIIDSSEIEKAILGLPKDYIKSVTLSNCKSIDSSTFSDCVNLKTVTIDNCNEIGSSAFSGCKNLDFMEYGGSTEPIYGSDVFKDCSSLKTVYVSPKYNGVTFCEIPVTVHTPTPTPTPTSTNSGSISITESSTTISIVPMAVVAAVAAVASVVCCLKKHLCCSRHSENYSEFTSIQSN